MLKYFTDHDGENAAPAIARALDLSPGPVLRIVKALTSAGLLARNPITESYYLGSGAVLLGQAAQRAFGLDRALPILEQVNLETQESVNLAVREARESVVMLRVQCTLPLALRAVARGALPALHHCLRQSDPRLLTRRWSSTSRASPRAWRS